MDTQINQQPKRGHPQKRTDRFKKGVHFLYKKLIRPKSKNEDSQRREFILNIILVSFIIFALLSFINTLINFIRLGSAAYSGRGMSPLVLFIVFLFFSILYILSRTGHFIVSAYILLLIHFIGTTYCIYKWGVSLHAGLLLYALLIVIAGILINTRFAFFTTLFTSLTLLIINYLHTHGIVLPNLYWKTNKIVETKEVIIFATMLCIIMVVSWLSNREIERSLKRARKSEAELKQERDLLEVKVDERTKQLKKAQLEKMEQLYRSAEFGNLSAGLFHDLVNPLTAISLNLGQIQNRENQELISAKTYLSQAISATKRMENFIIAVKKQITHQEQKTLFSLNEEIIQIIQLFSYKARKAGIEIVFFPANNIQTYGDAIKFSQIITNLISNAVDAYGNIEQFGKRREVVINLSIKDDIIYLTVQNWGKGISPEHINKIFEPFFTTKTDTKDLGIGLSIVKNIIEKDFSGNIKVKSRPEEETIFTVELPKKQNSQVI